MVLKKILTAESAADLDGGKPESLPGIACIMEKARQGNPMTAVFFGGSLTWGANASDPNLTSWRGLTMRMLREKYPRTAWTFYDAAIGGTDTSLGIFRLERDVLSRKPDLVFLEFTLNDGLEGSSKGIHDTMNQYYEFILRSCLEHHAAVLPVFLTSRKYTEMTDISQLKRRLEHIELCRTYQLEYADVLGLMNREFLAKQLDTEALWPKKLFDMTHPHDAGYAAYFRCFRQEWERIEKSPARTPVLPERPFSGENCRYRLRVEAAELNLPGWTARPPFIMSDTFDWMTSRWVDQVAISSNADQVNYRVYEAADRQLETLRFSFKGESLALILEVIPQSVPLTVSIDGEEPRPIKVREVKIAQFHHRILGSGLDPDKIHHAVIAPVAPAPGEAGVIRLGCILIHGRKHAQMEIDVSEK